MPHPPAPRLARLAAVGLATLLGAACSGDPEPAVDGDQVDPEALRDAMTDAADAARFPGLAACVLTLDGRTHCEGVGLRDPEADDPVTENTPFLLASVSKMVTAATAMVAVEDGALSLLAPVADHADFALQHPGGAAMTARQLLQHAAAVNDNDEVTDGYYTEGADPALSLDAVIRRYFDPAGADYDADANFADRAPGVAFEYANMGSALAGWVVERATGTPFLAFSRTAILEPLGLDATSWLFSDYAPDTLAMPSEWTGADWEPYGQYTFADYPNGGLRSSARDLARFGEMMLGDGARDGVRVLDAASVQEMTDASLPDGEGGAVGLGWFTTPGLGEGWAEHDGGEAGVATALSLNRELGVGFLYLGNGDGEDDEAIEGLEALLAVTAEALVE